MSDQVVVIRPNGSLVFLDTENLAPFKELGPVVTKRASHVEPANILLRPVFHALRLMFGDKGWMADFTRYWPCLWRVNVSPLSGPILSGRWSDRQDAINAEVEYLNEHLE